VIEKPEAERGRFLVVANGSAATGLLAALGAEMRDRLGREWCGRLSAGRRQLQRATGLGGEEKGGVAQAA
jgi:hypothetical protein